jgi:uncharacterized protein (DUF362 family)
VLDLHDDQISYKDFGQKKAGQKIPIPRILEEMDAIITMPVIKVHAMTKVSLALKNQWGLIPAKKRFLHHPAINDILVGINSLLPPAMVICDGRYALNENGPMFGEIKSSNLIAVSNDIGAFDYLIRSLMGFKPQEIDHLRAGMKAGMVPSDEHGIETNIDLTEMGSLDLILKRTAQNYLALAGFNHSWLNKLLYDSGFISDILHKILYAIKGNPLDEALDSREEVKGYF